MEQGSLLLGHTQNQIQLTIRGDTLNIAELHKVVQLDTVEGEREARVNAGLCRLDNRLANVLNGLMRAGLDTSK